VRPAFRRRPVDLVDEHEVGENGPWPKRELPRAAQQRDPRDVRGHQVGRELDALKFHVERQRQGAHQQGLGGPRHALEQHVAAGEEAHQGFARRRGLPENHAIERF